MIKQSTITKQFSYLMLPALFLLTSCGGDVKSELGLRHDAPDEFRVISAPPLTMPPDFGVLPKPGSSVATSAPASPGNYNNNPLAAPVTQVQSFAAPSPADGVFLTKIGAGTIDPSIRETIVKDNTPPPPEKKKGFFASLFHSDSKDPPAADAPAVVDAPAEKQRISDDQKANQPLTNGTTPTVKNDQSLFDRIFGKSDKDDDN